MNRFNKRFEPPAITLSIPIKPGHDTSPKEGKEKFPPIRKNQLIAELIGVRLVPGSIPAPDTQGQLALKYEQVG